MSKSELTKQLEMEIWLATKGSCAACCHEVTIGWFGNERVDYITCDTKGTWRCYEIKCSFSDFNSKAKITFVGHMNYYVLTDELYKQVADKIPDDIGVYVGGRCVKKAKRRELLVDHYHLSMYMMRSLYRAYDDMMRNGNCSIVQSYERQNKRLERDNLYKNQEIYELRSEIRRLKHPERYIQEDMR